MSIDVIMPKLGESITEATILEWKKKIGDSIDKDETLLEISTDKVDSEVPSPAAGIISEILFDKNDTVAVGEVIAKVSTDGANVVNIDNNKENNTVDTSKEIINKEEQIAEYQEIRDISQPKYVGNKFYSPLVKSIAKKEGVDLSELDHIEGSGHNGRINKKDILDFINNKTVEPKSDVKPSFNEYSFEDKLEPMGHIRKMIASHMVKSRDTSVHVYSSNEVDMTRIVEFRQTNKNLFSERYNTGLTYTPFIVDSVIRAINEFPLINVSIDSESIKHNSNINMGVAVALPDNNLIVPVINKSEELNFLGIARSVNDLADRARKGNLNPDEAQGSTFTITNPGVFGSLFGMGIINQPNVALLSVGSIHKRPVVKETDFGDVIVSRSMMYLTLAYDHRIIDGAYGTRFLSKIKEILENFNNDLIKL